MIESDRALAAETGAALRAALARYDEENIRHEEIVEESAARLALVGDELQDRLARHKAALDLAELPFPLALGRELYWEYPEVKVSQIATLLSIPSNMVHTYMGEYTIERECRGGCGRTLEFAVTTRTALRNKGGSWRRCQECTEEREARYQEDRRRSAFEHSEDGRLFDEAIAAGVKPQAVYVELPGVPGTWRVDQLPGDARTDEGLDGR